MKPHGTRGAMPSQGKWALVTVRFPAPRGGEFLALSTHQFRQDRMSDIDDDEEIGALGSLRDSHR